MTVVISTSAPLARTMTPLTSCAIGPCSSRDNPERLRRGRATIPRASGGLIIMPGRRASWLRRSAPGGMAPAPPHPVDVHIGSHIRLPMCTCIGRGPRLPGGGRQLAAGGGGLAAAGLAGGGRQRGDRAKSGGGGGAVPAEGRGAALARLTPTHLGYGPPRRLL